MRRISIITWVLVAICSMMSAQEQLAPLHGNIHLICRDQAPVQQNASQKTASVSSVFLPFFDDFSYAPLSPYPSVKYWADSSVYVNTGFGKAPPSIGVATFDGLNKNGYPYQLNAQPNVSAPADTLTSRNINLYQSSTNHIYGLADSIGFSFLYQSAGYGENPETDDSLILEFYKPDDSLTYNTVTSSIVYGTWNQVWGTRGVASPDPADSSFKFAFVQIKDTAYLHETFRFRFKNKATTSGSLDHWNIDYVTLKANHTRYDTLVNDVAFTYVPRPLLKNYSAIPFKQFLPTEMGSHFSNFIRSNYYNPTNPTDSSNVYYNYKVYDNSNTLLNSYTGGACNVGFFKTSGYSKCLNHAYPNAVANNFTFAPASETQFTIVHTLTTTPDVWGPNDTVVQTQVFGNYYAYDDGSAEAGYYLNAYSAETALRFTVNTKDTLQALDIYFDPVTQGNTILTSTFFMMVWGDGGGQPGALMMRDTVTFAKPTYLQFGYNKIPRYPLPYPIILDPGTYYVGIQQQTNQQLNIGFDRNIDHSNALFYNVTGTWHQSTIPGSLMIHPILGRASYVIGIDEQSKANNRDLEIYPNPASDLLYIRNLSGETNATLEIHSMLGDKVKELPLSQATSQVSVSDLSSGIYFAMLKTGRGILSQQKLIITR
ncbi:MAG: T9SS type A sorting domain-containing protein [Bacteroidia bacterium]